MGFQGSLALGKVGENDVFRYLIGRGFTILPAYELEILQRKGPRIQCPDKCLIAPDCLAMRDKRAVWVEVKWKAHFAWYRKTEEWTTGIDIHYYEHYLEVRKRFGFDLWVMFLHPDDTPAPADLRYQCPPKCPAGLYGREILELEKVRGYRRNGMIYWAEQNLKLIETPEGLANALRPPGGFLERGLT